MQRLLIGTADNGPIDYSTLSEWSTEYTENCIQNSTVYKWLMCMSLNQ